MPHNVTKCIQIQQSVILHHIHVIDALWIMSHLTDFPPLHNRKACCLPQSLSIYNCFNGFVYADTNARKIRWTHIIPLLQNPCNQMARETLESRNQSTLKGVCYHPRRECCSALRARPLQMQSLSQHPVCAVILYWIYSERFFHLRLLILLLGY